MFNKSFALVLVIAAGALLAPETPEACGPDFPTNMIVRRAEALSEMWSGSFVDESARLVPVSETDRTAFTREPSPVPAQQREQQLYDDAAAAFHAGDYAAAEKGFARLLNLPAAQRQRLSVAAAYSLGRTHALEYHTAAAVAAFRQVRTLVKAGFVDPDRLAVASFGAEAAVVRTYNDDIVGSVRLYAQQASLDESGALSLLVVMRSLVPADRASLGHDEVGARLLALYFYTRDGEIGEEDRPAWSRQITRSSTTEARGADYAAAAAYRSGEWARAGKLAALCRQSPIAMWVQAKLALRDGDRPRAEALLAQVERSRLGSSKPRGEDQSSGDVGASNSEAATLVRGELGLLALGDEKFTESMQWFAKGQRVVEASYVAERVLTLDEMHAAVVASAEQRRASVPVLRREGLDDSPPEEADASPVVTDDPAPPSETEDGEPIYLAGCDSWGGMEPSSCWPRRLLAMYARRTVRERHFDDALAAFGRPANDSDDAPDTSYRVIDFADDAREYIHAAQSASSATGIERAEQLFAAAKIMRERGMEIAGTETGPDWRLYDGNYARGLLCLPSPTGGYDAYAEDPETYDDWDAECVTPSRADVSYVSAAEVTRLRESVPAGEHRFAYRIVASQMAEQAAELVPPRSQAYGAALCWAATWAKRDQARVEALFDKFNRNGASGGWDDFDGVCAQPDFARARHFDDEQVQRRVQAALEENQRHAWTVDRVKKAAWRRKRYGGIPIAIVITFLTVYVVRRARRRRATLGTWGG